MAGLPLTQIPDGVHNYEYRGPVGVNGVDTTQDWDLSQIPDNVRKAIGFDDQLYILAKALDNGISDVDDQNIVIAKDSNGLPETLTLTLTSSDDNALIKLLVETKHTATR